MTGPFIQAKEITSEEFSAFRSSAHSYNNAIFQSHLHQGDASQSFKMYLYNASVLYFPRTDVHYWMHWWQVWEAAQKAEHFCDASFPEVLRSSMEHSVWTHLCNMWIRNLLSYSRNCFFTKYETSIDCVFGHLLIHNSLLRSHHNISTGLRSGLWLVHYKTLIILFFRHSNIKLLPLIIVAWPKFE